MAGTQETPRRERRENAERRRRQLLDAARRSILAHGLARTTLATVAAEAGLSQGVAVFYFRSKAGLLAATLADLYQGYEALWTGAMEAAGPDPRDRLDAVLEADFTPLACGPEVLPLWFAFWGELRFTGPYAGIAEAFEARRREALTALWGALLPGADRAEAERLAGWMDTLTDGYWQRLHLAPESLDRAGALASARACLARLAPGLA